MNILFYSYVVLVGTDIHLRFNESVISTFVDAILFEPTNKMPAANPYIEGKHKSDRVFSYLDGNRSKKLNVSLKEFASPQTALVDSSEVRVLRCKGPSMCHPGHNFIAACCHAHVFCVVQLYAKCAHTWLRHATAQDKRR